MPRVKSQKGSEHLINVFIEKYGGRLGAFMMKAEGVSYA